MNDGSFLVSDGYCNSRIVRFNPDGSQHSQYKLPLGDGKLDSNANSGGKPMGVAHSLVLDECDGEVTLADRENARVHRFNMHTHVLEGMLRLRCAAPWQGLVLLQNSVPSLLAQACGLSCSSETILLFCVSLCKVGSSYHICLKSATDRCLMHSCMHCACKCSSIAFGRCFKRGLVGSV